MATKRQQTMAKMARERAVKEKRALKAEKKQLAREMKAAGITPDTYTPDTEPSDEQA